MFALLVLWITRICTLFAATVTILPFIPTGAWFVRICDFPRLQILQFLLIPLSLTALHAVLKRGIQWEHGVMFGVLAVIAIWQASHVLPFTPLWRKELADSKQEDAIHFMVANLQYDNDQHDEVRKVIESHDPDLLLLIEINEDWMQALRPLREKYSHHTDVVRDEGLGIALWSKFPMRNTTVRHLVSDERPSIFADVELPDGSEIRICGVHPTPPGLREDDGDGRRDSRVRDAELVLVAREVKADPHTRWIVAGDFNDVAWSHTTRLFKRLSGLEDPRVGRMLLNTYHAEHPLWRYPIDQLFLPAGSTVHSLQRVRLPGADHFAVMSEFHVAPSASTPEASAEDEEEAEEIVEEGTEDAREEGEESDEVEAAADRK